MKQFLSILVLVCAAAPAAWVQSPSAASPPAPIPSTKGSSPPAAVPLDKEGQENAQKARQIIDQGIQALGGQTYLTIRDREQQGRGYSLHHGQAGGGSLFWSFSEFPDKERVELTKERDVAEIFVGDKGYEVTFKGPHPVEQKDLDDYLRRRHYALDRILRTWVNDPGVILLFEGSAVAAQKPAVKVTLINAQNESVSLYFDAETHLPIKKTFEWRDPVDRQKNLEEEVYDNYKPVSGIMAPYSVTRFFNGDMSNQRFLNSVTINQGLDPAMFDPKSGYDPNKPVKGSKKK